jgi:hypothetical protein
MAHKICLNRSRCPVRCSSKFCDRSPPCAHRRQSDVEDQPLSWPVRLLLGDARQNPASQIERPVTLAIAAPQQRERRIVTDAILVKTLQRRLRSAQNERNQGSSWESRL